MKRKTSKFFFVVVAADAHVCVFFLNKKKDRKIKHSNGYICNVLLQYIYMQTSTKTTHIYCIEEEE